MKNFVIISLMILLLTTCANKDNSDIPIQTSEQTPEVLEGDFISTNTKSIRNKNGENIMDQLYDEAMDKNPKLKLLSDDINNLRKNSKDSLSNYHRYMRINRAFLNLSVKPQKIISDSTIARSVKEIFDKYNNDFNSTTKVINSKKESIDNKQSLLLDYHYLLKVIVTTNMMYNFMENEKPDIRTMNYIEKSYDSLILETQKTIKGQ